jgi:hypothetical protein
MIICFFTIKTKFLFSSRNVRKILLNFEGYFNSERSRLGMLFNRNFPNNKITATVAKVEDKNDEEKVVKKAPKQKPKPENPNKPIKKKMKQTKKKPPRAPKKALPVKKQSTLKVKMGVSRAGPRKRAASPHEEAPSAKSARGSRRNRSASPQPDKKVATPTRGRRSGANGKATSREVVSSSSSSRSPSPRPASKPFVTPATKKAFPETPSSASDFWVFEILSKRFFNGKFFFAASHNSQSFRISNSAWVGRKAQAKSGSQIPCPKGRI